MDEIVIFWFRRDLRVHDNTALYHALISGFRVLPLFIYDTEILGRLEKDDRRMSFLRDCLINLNNKLNDAGSSLLTITGKPAEIFRQLSGKYKIRALYFNRDYEPYARKRDYEVISFLNNSGVPSYTFRDHVIFEADEILKNDGSPYTVFTPYKNKWLTLFNTGRIKEYPSQEHSGNFVRTGSSKLILPEILGFTCPHVNIRPLLTDRDHIASYDKKRDFPSEEGTTNLGPHLRFGTVSIREIMRKTLGVNQVFTSELIWREFFMQILYHFPHVTEKSFRPEYDRIDWLNNEEHFRRWCEGTTGVPLVDAGMRELAQTGYMHNRVRMVAANYLTKILLTDWRWGEAWFAEKLLDYELSSNNGNWQWAAGSGCDAAPWFRIFNPELQAKKFDSDNLYIRKWIPEFGTPDYPPPVVSFHEARERALQLFRKRFS